MRQLGQHDGGKNEGAAHTLPQRKALVQQQPAAQGAEHAFQTHDKAGDGGVQVFLSQDLERIARTAGQYAAIGDGQEIGTKFRQRRRLKEKRRRRALHCDYDKLQEAQPHAVHQRRKVVDGHDLEAEQHRAGEQDPVAGLDAAEAVLHAEQVKAHHGDDHAGPELGAALPAQKQAEHRHQHDVHGRQEARLGRGGVDGDADLLGRRGCEQKGAADEARRQQSHPLRLFLGPAVGRALLFAQGIKGGHGREQHEDSQPAPPREEGIGPHAGACALGHERRAPDEGAEHQHERIFRLCLHAAMPSTLSPP